MKRLPVPPLPQTMRRYVETVAPLLDARQLADTRAAVDAFESGDGPACQEALEAFADIEHDAGRNWMSQAWLAGYFATRGALPLTSNVAFHVRWDSARRGLSLAADVIASFADVHLAYLRGDAPPDRSARGDVLCQLTWEFLGGAIRHPRPGQDVFAPGRSEAARREVIVLHRGTAVALPVSDDRGRLLSRAAVEDALRGIGATTAPPSPAFTAPGYLGGDAAAAFMDDLLGEADNVAAYDRLRDSLFVVHLFDGAASVAERLHQTGFERDQGYPFKPVTLQVSLAEDAFVGLQIEHSTMDGGAIGAVIGRAQQASAHAAHPCRPAASDPELCDATDGAPPVADVAPAGTGGSGPSVRPTPLAWTFTTAQEDTLTAALAAYDEQVSGYRVRIVTTPVCWSAERSAALPFRLSHDACQQLVMLYAQLRTYGRVRSTYESVDMREYQAGRTECLRPNTAAAVTFVDALVRGEAGVDLLRAALDAHRHQVKICKSGQAIDRHLFGLRLMADRDGYRMPLVDDAGYRALTTDFLSTTSLGDQSRIIRAAFAPTSPDGIGIYYTPTPDGAYEFCLNYDERTCEGIEEFAQALGDGTTALFALLATL